ncbi:putative Calexcitin-1 [Hypsibius exemplaris]|uniref:Calexcitin-1 n=1 Tax=Hypsibius exemplaris TaxID=2072580 RepID=A0A1W0WWZ2_HYPEX|nr:putative Calexcitin-1 [Hypsibius exemplaris]
MAIRNCWHLFHTFFDANQNGTIDKKDFDMALEKTAKNRSLSAGDAKHKEVQESLSYVWEHLKKVADRDNDGTVSTEEWLKMWDEAISAKQNPPWVDRYQSFLFEAEDVTGDGKVDEQEYTTAYTSYGVAADECKNAFKKLTNGGPDTISKDVFEKRFQEFVTSNDPNAAGNYLFGKASF